MGKRLIIKGADFAFYAVSNTPIIEDDDPANPPIDEPNPPIIEPEPEEYTRLTAIKNVTSNGYFSTGIIADDSTGMYVKYSAAFGTTDKVICGSRATSGDSRFTLGQSTKYYAGWNTSNRFTAAPVNDAIVELSLNLYNNRKAILNDTEEVALSGTLVQQSTDITFFRNNNASGPSTSVGITMYECKITHGNELIRHYVFVRRNLDNAIGALDLVNNEFKLFNNTNWNAIE